MPFMRGKRREESELSRAAKTKHDKKSSFLQNALNNYEYHKKRKKKKRMRDMNDQDNFSL